MKNAAGKIDKQQLIQLKMKGYNNSECARVFCCSASAVQQMCVKLKSDGLLPAQVADYIAEKHLQSDTEVDGAKTETVRLSPTVVEPSGVVPRKMWIDERRDELRRAICEFACEGMRINLEWVEEYNDLIEEE